VKCVYCGSPDTSVIDSRETEDGKAIRRRRSCVSCPRRFTTYERVEEMALQVIKRDNRRQLFDRTKLVAGMRRACEKRPVSTSDLEEIASSIERAAQELGEREIAGQWFGEQVMKALRQIDEVAYVRFASVYRSFRDMNEFAEELNKMRREDAHG